MKPLQASTEWRYLYAGITLVVAAFYFFSIHIALSPFIAFVLLLLLIAPYAGTDRHTTLVLAATFALGIWLLESVGSLLAPFILSFVLAYILDPAVDMLQRRGMKRGIAVTLLVLPVLGLLGLTLVIAIPALINQLEALLQRLPAAGAQISEWLVAMRSGTSRFTVPFVSEEVLQRWLDPDRIAEFVSTQQDAIAQGAWTAVGGFGRGLGIVLSILGFIVLTPVLVVYLLRDFDHITDRVAELVPASRRVSWLAFMREYDSLLSRFLRGQVIAATLVGLMTWIGLWIAGVPYSGLVGATAGVFNLVPYLGLIVSVIPIIIISLLSDSFLAMFLKAGIVLAVIQAIDGAVTGPRIVGDSVGLHPVWVLFALALGSFYFGFVGLLIAMPAAVLIKLLVREALSRYRRSPMFLGTSAGDEQA